MRRKYPNNPILLVSFVLCISGYCYPQSFLHTDGKSIVDGPGNEFLIRSIGLGGWMLQEGYMLETSAFAGAQHEIRAKIEELIGPENTDTFYTAWLNNHVRRIDIDSLATWGFNTIRLPMHYNLFTPQNLPVGEYINTGFELIDSLLSWCSANQIYLILDLHGAPGGQGDDAAISDYDPAKPSLWESEENKARTADLWKTLAARYADEEWIGGYDLINEPKWDALLDNNNHDLWELLIRITDSIRTVDPNHMLIIEGNMWANDYTGFQGPWDNNMVISFHKYWNPNNTASIQWVLDMRNQYDVPVWLGETGENSNTWFVELIELMEQNSIGYSFWPEKKFTSVVGPVTIIKTEAYQQLLDYWTSPTQHPRPDTSFAKETLMQMVENLKLEHCRINRDVIDAFTRQVNNTSTIPFQTLSLPGIIHATDYDMGKQACAYFDSDYQNTGNNGTWNIGGKYRNDGVDIEECTDTLYSNGFNVGWTSAGEWLKYTVQIDSTAGYSLLIRYAGMNSSTLVHLALDSLDITGEIEIPPTGAWNVWDSLTLSDVILSEGEHSLVLYFDDGGCNLGWFAFENPKLISDVAFKAVSAETDTEGTSIYLTLNKECSTPMTAIASDFSVLIGDVESGIQNVSISPVSAKILVLDLEIGVSYDESIFLSYEGSSVQTVEGQLLENFTLSVKNNLPDRHLIPGKIEAEEFYEQSGLETETTTDAGGGLNIGYTDAGDYLDYLVDIQSTQYFQVNFRVAALNQAGSVQLILYDEEQNQTILGNFPLPVTGGWQTWQTQSGLVELPAGFYTLRVKVISAGFNLNWLSFTEPSSTENILPENGFILFPNPCRDEIFAQKPEFSMAASNVKITDLSGIILTKKDAPESDEDCIRIDISSLQPGLYVFSLIYGSSSSSMLFMVED
jgi:endoglucanase